MGIVMKKNIVFLILIIFLLSSCSVSQIVDTGATLCRDDFNIYKDGKLHKDIDQIKEIDVDGEVVVPGISVYDYETDLSTARGIKIGAFFDDVKKAYSNSIAQVKDWKENDTLLGIDNPASTLDYTYSYGEYELTFKFLDDKVNFISISNARSRASLDKQVSKALQKTTINDSSSSSDLNSIDAPTLDELQNQLESLESLLPSETDAPNNSTNSENIEKMIPKNDTDKLAYKVAPLDVYTKPNSETGLSGTPMYIDATVINIDPFVYGDIEKQPLIRVENDLGKFAFTPESPYSAAREWNDLVVGNDYRFYLVYTGMGVEESIGMGILIYCE